VLRINDFIALIVAQRTDYVNNQQNYSVSTRLQVQPIVYLGSVPHDVTLPGFPENRTVCEPSSV